MKSLLLKLSDDEHAQIKAMAALNHQTIKSFILTYTLYHHPNAETLAAIEELEKKRGSLKRYDTFSDLLNDTLKQK